MTALALAVLIYLGAAAIWDIVDPDAVTIKFGSTFRALVAVAAQVAMFALCLTVLAASAVAVVGVVAGYIILMLLSAALKV